MASAASPQIYTFVFGKAGGRQTTALEFAGDDEALTFAKDKLAELHRDGAWTYVGISRQDRVFADKLGAWWCDDGTLTWRPNE
jgi:hypothetical protein